MWFFKVCVSHKSRNLLERSRHTLGLKHTLGAYRPIAGLIPTATQSTGLSVIQPCQMPCINPLDTSLSCAGSFWRAEREKEWTRCYDKHVPAGRKLSSAPNGWQGCWYKLCIYLTTPQRIIEVTLLYLSGKAAEVEKVNRKPSGWIYRRFRP